MSGNLGLVYLSQDPFPKISSRPAVNFFQCLLKSLITFDKKDPEATICSLDRVTVKTDLCAACHVYAIPSFG